MLSFLLILLLIRNWRDSSSSVMTPLFNRSFKSPFYCFAGSQWRGFPVFNSYSMLCWRDTRMIILSLKCYINHNMSPIRKLMLNHFRTIDSLQTSYLKRLTLFVSSSPCYLNEFFFSDCSCYIVKFDWENHRVSSEPTLWRRFYKNTSNIPQLH